MRQRPSKILAAVLCLGMMATLFAGFGPMAAAEEPAPVYDSAGYQGAKIYNEKYDPECKYGYIVTPDDAEKPSANDALYVLQVSVHKEGRELDAEQEKRADCDLDGRITASAHW